jgi:hypothetical protein
MARYIFLLLFIACRETVVIDDPYSYRHRVKKECQLEEYYNYTDELYGTTTMKYVCWD